MFSCLNRLSVRNRIWAIVAVFIGSIILGSIIDVLILREGLWSEKERATRQQVQSGYSILVHYHGLQTQGKLSEPAAQAAAIGALRAMRYGDQEYFWINDLGLPAPRMIMHPTQPELDGRRLDDPQFNCATGMRVGDEGRFDGTDGKKNLFAAFVELANRGGQGYVTYTWPKPLPEGGVTSYRVDKLSYVKKFAPWGWLIGSGVYVDDVERAVRAQAARQVMVVAGGSLVLLLLASILASSITQPLRETVLTMRKIIQGDLTQRLPDDGDGEIAELARGFNEMQAHLQAHAAVQLQQHEWLEDEVARRTVELQDKWLLEKELAERERTDHLLRESRARISALLDASGESVLLLDPEGKVLVANARAAARFGRSPDDLAGSNFFDVIPAEQAASRRAAVQQVAATGAPLHMQDQRGGTYFDNSLYPVENESGVVESIAVYAKDVTEQRHAKQVEDIFHRLDTVLLKWRVNLESIAQMFCDELLPAFDLAGAWIGRAEKDGRLTPLGRAEAGRGGVLDALQQQVVRWDEAEGWGASVGAAIRGGQRQRELSADCADRQCCALARALGAPVTLLLPLTLGGANWGVLAMYGREAGQFDAPETLSRLDAVGARLGVALEAASQQEWLTLLDTALAGVGNAVFITDPGGVILWANRALEMLSGYAIGDVLGKTPRLFHSGAQSLDFYQRFWNAIKSGITWRGEIVNRRRDGRRYTASQTVTPLLGGNGQVSHYVAVLEDISERKASEERMQHTANYDALTDLPNRACFFDRLGQALTLARREAQPGALLFLDLDRFKQVNDQLGHAAGDALLVGVAQRLREQVRESDTVARLAGDEFTVILPRLATLEAAASVADKILAAIAAPFAIAGTELTIGISIGIALFPQHGATVEEVLNAADHAMYRAKKAGRNGYAFAEAEAAVAQAAAAEPILVAAHGEA
jgi:diguanylate cyclase (GGDEF)-like protein/PAS domain S-box-containing protein